ncbi:Bcbas1 [Botrytis cinerea B05.10]|uniref:Bcbas1 n=3 Tax=Botryotinia fuckeliana TaxID=40559 RepID=A0A384K4D4_BOTFB|nr:Bcbas1 [Botrytis cinerea B05.10]ATZ57689.1 Bcbas1 [Botrytis cinerea B05.10]EMR88122.1 putative dna-binding protein [Botrytis cinerea BcDW1]CCD47331.1 hypothetical protein BofuT4P2000037001 [Botrytis cinerea T4]
MAIIAPSPSRVRKYWTDDEDQILRREATLQFKERGIVNDWNLIASKVRGRTNKDCRKRWSKVGKEVNKGLWDHEEDDRLRRGVDQHGTYWTMVAEIVQTRHADQCAKRWYHFLDPNISHEDWDSDEEARLLEAVHVHGRSWKSISEKEFPNRSPTDIKNRYVIMERKGRLKRRKASTTQCTPVRERNGFEFPKSERLDQVLNTESSPDNAMEYDTENSLMGQLPLPGLPLQLTAQQLSQNNFNNDAHSLFNFDGLPPLQFNDMSYSSTEPSSPGISLAQNSVSSGYNMGIPTVGSLTNEGEPDIDQLYCEDMNFDLALAEAFSAPDHRHSIASTPPTMSSVSDVPAGHNYKLILEDVKPDTLFSIVNMLVESRSNVKMEVFSNVA